MRIDAGQSNFLNRRRGPIAWIFAGVGGLVVLFESVAGGWPGFIGATATLAVFVWCWSAVEKWLDRRIDQKRRREPCRHGIVGAARNPSRCVVCAKSVADARLARQRAEAEEARRQHEEYRAWAAKVSQQSFLKTVDPQEFEKIVCRLFARMGYRVEETRYVGDNGSDGFLYKEGKKVVLQCKRVQGSVGEPVLRDLFGTMHATECQGAMVVTTGTVSLQARKWSSGKPIRIIELEELSGLFRQHFPEDEIGDGCDRMASAETRHVQFACSGCQRQLRVPRMNPKLCATCPDCGAETIIEPA